MKSTFRKMKITRPKFYFITLLIILIPLYSNWKLFVFGKVTTGEVVELREEITLLNVISTYPILEFQSPKGKHQLVGPENVYYPIGSEFKILYYRMNPDYCIIFNLSNLILNTKTIIAGLLLIFWTAFYLSFLNSSSRNFKNRRSKIFKPNSSMRISKLSRK
ncbi:MAG: hypothetical protein ACEPOZ_18930 [Marinifilaceae bacterium]